ncbi:MAG: suppressor of tub2 mutation [Caeruleum heppii]|nr:MAG: suppressor of tub2 mutation [Caeruleum heppii]
MSKAMEAKSADLLVIMRSSGASIDTKTNGLNDLKSSIKHYHVPDAIVPTIFDVIRIAMSSPHSSLVAAGFSILGHLIKRLTLQDPKHIALHGPRILPLLVERLGDQRDRHRALAAQCLGDLWPSFPQDVERTVRDSAMTGKNPRAKEASMHWLAKMSKEKGLQFRSFVPKLVDALEDADGMVRDTAKATVVELFHSAPHHAKSDLKKQLQQRGVRKAIAAEVIAQLDEGAASEVDLQSSTNSSAPPEPLKKDTAMTASVSGLSHHSSSSQAPPEHESGGDTIEPSYVNTQRELEEVFRDMQPCFEGRESEGNWIAREKSVIKLRRITKGNAIQDYYTPYLAGIKTLLDGILKAVNSLRTTLSSTGCSLVQEIAKATGSGLDPMVEILLQNLIKLCAGTKKISASNGNITVDVIFAHISYSIRVMQHLWAACQDKNVQPRTFAAGWLKTIITKHGHHKSHIEHTGGLEYIEKSIKKGLADPNPGVREAMRKTFWVFAGIWHERAEMIMSALDANSKRLLEKDSGNPNSPRKALPAALTTTLRPTLAAKGTSATASQLSLKEAIAARKREAAAAAAAQATKDLPPRPGSAQSSFSPVKQSVNTSSAAPPGLSSRPMRPPKRPDLTRPATAGPYSVRKPVKAENHSVTPAAKAASKAPNSSTPEHSPSRSRPKAMDSPSMASIRSEPARHSYSGPSPTKAHEELTMVMPNLALHGVMDAPLSDRGESSLRLEPPVSLSHEVPELQSKVDLDPFQSGPLEKDNNDLAPLAPPLRVYEDPTTGSEAEVKPDAGKRSSVLEEKTVNEPVLGAVTAPGSDQVNGGRGKMDSPEKARLPSEKPDEHRNVRRLLESGIARVRAGNIDAHGLRKLQSMIRSVPDAQLEDSRFVELYTALLSHLELPSTDTKAPSTPSKGQDVKVQVLHTIRAMLNKRPASFSADAPRALCAVLTARGFYDTRSHIVSVLEEVAERLCECEASELCISRVLNFLTEADRSAGKHTLCMGVHVLGGLMLETGPRSETSEGEVQRLGQLAVRCLNDLDPDIRKNGIDFCLSFYGTVTPPRFWQMLEGTKEDQRNLITYYLARAE